MIAFPRADDIEMLPFIALVYDRAYLIASVWIVGGSLLKLIG
jgi:hypothetical protein